MLAVCMVFFFQAEDGIRDLVRSRGLGDVYKRQGTSRRRPAPVRGARSATSKNNIESRCSVQTGSRSCPDFLRAGCRFIGVMEPELPEIRDLAMDTPLPAVVPVRCAVDIDEIETELFGQLHVELGVTEINGSAAERSGLAKLSLIHICRCRRAI